MKKILFLALSLYYLEGSAQQKVYNLDVQKKESTATLTGDVAILKGVNYPVYMTKTGKLFIVVVSKKSGKEYRKYLKNG